MRIVGQENIFLRNVISTIIKGTNLDMGTIYNGTLYLLVNHGILYTVDMTQYFPIETSCTFTFEDYKYTDEYLEDNPLLQDSFINRFLNVLNAEQYENNLIYHEPDCRENESFEQIVSSKATEGASRYYIDTKYGKTFMYLYKPMFGLSKADRCGLKVYTTIDLIVNLYFSKRLAVFNIYKSKLKLEYKMYFVFIDMIGGTNQ